MKALSENVLFGMCLFSHRAWDQRIGYNKTVTDEMCSQWKYRPSEKYIASIQYKSYK